MTPFEAIQSHRLVPVITLDRESDAKPLGEALLAGGLPIAEVTLRTDAALASIKMMAEMDGLVVGAGTVINVDQAKAAHDAGATFMISPGFHEGVVKYCLDNGILITPGIATPTDIIQALECGIDVVKFFPASAYGGLNTLKAIAAPFPQVKFVPTGGINTGNLGEYLAHPSIVACGGSWMVKPSLVLDGKFDEITKLTQEAMALTK